MSPFLVIKLGAEMKFDLNKFLTNYKGQPFTREVHGESGTLQEPLTLREILESACLNADSVQHNDGIKKMVIFNLLMKVHKADPCADFTAEEISLLKDLIGKQLTVLGVGAVYAALEKPVSA